MYQDAAGGGTDSYIPPYHTGHTGWTVTGDYGRQLVFKDGGVGQYSAGWANKVDLPGSTGADDYRRDIRGCNPQPVGIAAESETCAGYPQAGRRYRSSAGCIGVRTGVSAGPSAGRRETRRRWWVAAARRSGSRRAVELVGRGPDGQTGGVVDAGGALKCRALESA